MQKDNSLPAGLADRMYRFVVISIVLFFITSITGALLGRMIDEEFNTAPWGSLLTLASFYVVSWLLVFAIRRRLKREIRAKKAKNST